MGRQPVSYDASTAVAAYKPKTVQTADTPIKNLFNDQNNLNPSKNTIQITP